jgi:hypothetical protein
VLRATGQPTARADRARPTPRDRASAKLEGLGRPARRTRRRGPRWRSRGPPRRGRRRGGRVRGGRGGSSP